MLGVIVRIPPPTLPWAGHCNSIDNPLRRGEACAGPAGRPQACMPQLLDQKLAQIRAEPVQPLGSPAAV